MVILVVELEVLELDVLGAALAPLRPGPAVLHMSGQFSRRYLQLAQMAGHLPPRALLLLGKREKYVN